ncbi:DUF1453 domain-containing protein [Streptomyces sp. NPDC020983]|uniref:DUF1453 domain-containing protein n=1 Tax=Streptomyces sp. NPDC020983 TaxID=3365106 RepID=UPI003799AD19
MSGWLDALVITAVLGLVIARQIRPRRVSAGARWWLIPAVLMVLAIRDGGLVDPAHRGLSVVLLCAELMVGAGVGLAWAGTTRMWAGKDGSVWTQGTRASITVWGMGTALRVALYAAGAAAGVREETGSVLLAVGLTLLTRAALLVRRARGVEPSYRTVA